jgi:sugar phosphate permease
MWPIYSIVALLLLGTVVFVPAFIIAMAMLGSAARAFVLSATFTVDGMAGFFATMLVSGLVLDTHVSDPRSLTWMFAFASAGAVGCAVLAVFLLGRLSRYPPWRRY